MRTLALLVATAGGAGYAPRAPGTVASLLALPLVPLIAGLRDSQPLICTAVVLAVLVLATWSAGSADQTLGGHDDGRIVIDEVAGMVVTGALVPATWLAAALGFAAFRVFDIWKPPPIGWCDRHLRGGTGVVADDVLAGIYAAVVVRVLVDVL